MATYTNLFIDQGSNFSFTIDLEQTVGTLDLSAYTSSGSMAKSYDGTTKATFSVDVDSVNKRLNVSLTKQQTAGLKPGRYVYDIIIVSGDSPSKVTRVLEGQVDVTPGVTFDTSAPET